MTENSKAQKAVAEIVQDLCDRRGLSQEWEGIDAKIQREILERWVELVEQAMEPETAVADRDPGALADERDALRAALGKIAALARDDIESSPMNHLARAVALARRTLGIADDD